MARKKQKPISNLIVVSDTHCGCKVGLCSGVPKLDDGGQYIPSELQIDIMKRWAEFWDEWVPQATKGEPFAVVMNGDAIDGIHHRAVTQISQNLTDQGRIAYECLSPVVKVCEGRYYHIRGTEAHVGPSGQEEERLAKELGAIPDKDGRYARWELWLELGGSDGGLVHLSHHIGTAGSLAYETSAVHKELEQAFVEAARWGNRPPDCIVRSHRHRNVETRIQTGRGFATACTTAGWQAKTPFVYKIAGGRQTLPQVGGTLVRWDGEDIYTRHRLWNLRRPETERLVV
jgi:hypothetical protein